MSIDSASLSIPGARSRWLLFGLALLATQVAVLGLSTRFAYGAGVAHMPVLSYVAVAVLAGALYLALPSLVRRTPSDAAALGFMLGVGVMLRLCLFPSVPILEDDFYRYLWDGAVSNRGFNPYSYAPSAVSAGLAPDELSVMARSTPLIFERINYPHLSTLYPPVAQAAFALAHWLDAWGLGAWRTLLMVADLATLGLLIVLLRCLGRSSLWSALYWWNPLLVKETFNSAHMDVLLLPLLLAALLLAIRRKPVWASASLALATGVKLWPALLLVVILRDVYPDVRKLMISVGVFSVLVLAQATPVLLAGVGSDSGFIAYGRGWEMNDALFMMVSWLAHGALGALAVPSLEPAFAARCAVAAIVLAITLWSVREPARDPTELSGRFLIVVAALFLLSPAQFPWYYVWLVPFLALQPRYSLLSLTALLPLYYLRFYLNARGQAVVFDYGVVWIEYLPVWVLLWWEWTQRRQPRVALGWSGAR